MLPVTLLTPPWRLVSPVLVAVSLATLPTYLLALVLIPARHRDGPAEEKSTRPSD